MCVKEKLEETAITLEHQRGERMEMMEHFCILHHKVNHMIDCWNGNGNKDVTKKELKEFPNGCWVEINKGVKIKRMNDLPGEILVFETIMEKGSEFGLHMHSDCNEYCEVISGKIVDIKSNMTYSEGIQAFWNKGIEHVPVALQDSKLMVYFK